MGEWTSFFEIVIESVGAKDQPKCLCGDKGRGLGPKPIVEAIFKRGFLHRDVLVRLLVLNFFMTGLSS